MSIAAINPTPTLPLTTFFKEGTSCGLTAIETWRVEPPANRNAPQPTLIAAPLVSLGCLPTGFNVNAQVPVFSPGVCPLGFYAAVASDAPTDGKPRTSYCCPSGAHFPTTFNGKTYCYTTITHNFTENIAKSTTSGTEFQVTLLEYQPGLYEGDKTVIGLGMPYTVAWASSDLHRFTPASAPFQVSVSTYVSAASAMAMRMDSNNNSSMSLRLKVAVGIVLGLVFFGILVFIMSRLLHQRKRRREKASSEYEQSFHGKVELSGHDAMWTKMNSTSSELSSDGAVIEMDVRGKEAVELEQNYKRFELGQNTEVYELPGDFHGVEVESKTQVRLAPDESKRDSTAG